MFDKVKEAAALAVAKRQTPQGQTAIQQQVKPISPKSAAPQPATEQPGAAAQRVVSKPATHGQRPQPSQVPANRSVQKSHPATNEVPSTPPPKTAQDTPKEVTVRPALPTEQNEKLGILNKVRESAGKHVEGVGKDLGLEQITAQLKERADGIGVNVQTKIKQSKEMIDEFSLSGKVKEFTLASVKVAQEIDAELQKENCQYEVNNFRVSASAGMMAGMTLDLHFTKTLGAKKVSEQESKYLSIINPGTGKPLKVLRSAVHGKDTVKLKDPDTGEVLVADTTSGKVLEIHPPAQATPS